MSHAGVKLLINYLKDLLIDCLKTKLSPVLQLLMSSVSYFRPVFPTFCFFLLGASMVCYPCLLGVKSIHLKVFISSRYSPSVFFCVFVKLIMAPSIKVIGTHVACSYYLECSLSLASV